MVIEGQGCVEPAPVRVPITAGDILLAEREAERRERHRGYAGRPDQWGAGLIPNANVIGLVGEIALARFASAETGADIRPNFALTRFGDRGCDIVVAGYRHQLKTAGTPYRELLLRTAEMDHPADEFPHFLVRAQWPVAFPDGGGSLFAAGERFDESVCELRGFIDAGEFMRLATAVPARRGAHTNYSLPACHLKSMRDLALLWKARLSRIGRGV